MQPVRPAIRLVDLKAQRRRLRGRIEAAIRRVLAHGQFIMGPEVAALEAELARYVGVRHAVSCASGTDALLLILMARRVGPGDAVLVPAFTFAAAAEAVALLGATPVFVDVQPATFDLDPASLRRAIAMLDGAAGPRPRAVIAVDLFGQPADYETLRAIARTHGLFLLQDAAQSFGARWHAQPAGRQGDAAATSFYPSKPLGAYGDGGAVLTDDDDLAAEIRLLRLHGQVAVGAPEHRRVGLNSRLDTLQAAILLAKLSCLDDELAARHQVAARYTATLCDVLRVPVMRPEVRSTFAQFTVLVEDRERLIEALRAEGIPTAIHYARPLHRQPAYRDYPVAPGGLPVAEALARTALSLPLHPDLGRARQARVIAAVRRFFGKKGA